jgi:hypothetical protein
MKRESLIYYGLAAFFFIVATFYYFTGRYDGNRLEWAGLAALTLSGLMMLMLGGVFHLTGRKLDPRPEDRPDAEVVEGAGDIGFFPPRSIWPFWCAVTAGLVFLGPVFGWWLTVLGFGFGLYALAGWLYQYYRGDYQH